MTIADLKKTIARLPDDMEIVLVGWNPKVGTIKRPCNRCLNLEHQEKVNEFWISTESPAFPADYKTTDELVKV